MGFCEDYFKYLLINLKFISGRAPLSAKWDAAQLINHLINQLDLSSLKN